MGRSSKRADLTMVFFYGFSSSLVQALMRVGMQGQKREFQYTHIRSSPPNDHSANHVTHHCFDMQKGGASSKWAGLCLKGHLRRGKTRRLVGNSDPAQ